MNPIHTDSYKTGQHNQHPPKTTSVHSHFCARGGRFREVTFFGLQYQLLKYFARDPATADQVARHYRRMQQHFRSEDAGGFNLAGWMHVVNDHNGYLPISVRALPEGTTVPVGNALFTVDPTCPKCYWATDYAETLLVQNWYPTAVCTDTRHVKKTLLKYLELTGNPELIEYKLHCFGFRGASSVESAGIGGLAHLVNFLGTDTLKALEYGEDYYGVECAGFSIPATQHSTIGSWGRDGERDAFRNFLRNHPGRIIACVSDTYNIWDACEKLWGEDLKAEVLGRDGTLVVRPDSGKPIHVIVDRVVKILDQKFGSTRNVKGYKVLDPHVSVVQGDGVNSGHDLSDEGSIGEVCWTLMQSGYSTDNITFGRGSNGLQEVKRDDIGGKFACSSVTVDGVERDVYKDPITDQGKKSLRGRVAVIFDPKAGYRTVRAEEAAGRDLLQEVYRNGAMQYFNTWDVIRQRAALPIQQLLPSIA